MLPQKILINVSIDFFASANKNDGTFLAAAAFYPQDHLHRRSLGKGRDADAGVHISYREVRQVITVAFQVPGEDFSSEKIRTS